MSKFTSSPNLPDNKIKKVICGTKDKKILSFFEKHLVEVVEIEANSDIDSSIALHADISVLHLGGKSIIVEKTQTSLIKKLSDLGMKVFTTKNHIAGEYPADISLNFSVFGEYTVGNFRYADENLVNFLKDKKQISVKQGYCKCSMLIINDSAIITDDESIHKEMISNGIDSLLVSKGDIELEGHEYGFIGGASFKLSSDIIVFCGDVTKHKDYHLIEEFINKHGCKILSTDDGKLRDIGGVICISENN